MDSALSLFTLIMIASIVLRFRVASVKKNREFYAHIKEKQVVYARPEKDRKSSFFYRVCKELSSFFLWLFWLKKWPCYFYFRGNSKTKGFLKEKPSSRDRVKAKVVAYREDLKMYELQEIE